MTLADCLAVQGDKACAGDGHALLLLCLIAPVREVDGAGRYSGGERKVGNYCQACGRECMGNRIRTIRLQCLAWKVFSRQIYRS